MDSIYRQLSFCRPFLYSKWLCLEAPSEVPALVSGSLVPQFETISVPYVVLRRSYLVRRPET